LTFTNTNVAEKRRTSTKFLTDIKVTVVVRPNFMEQVTSTL